MEALHVPVGRIMLGAIRDESLGPDQNSLLEAWLGILLAIMITVLNLWSVSKVQRYSRYELVELSR
jgi:hypothetical protein